MMDMKKLPDAEFKVMRLEAENLCSRFAVAPSRGWSRHSARPMISRNATSTTVTPLSQPAVYMETTSAVPVMTTVIYGADGMIYAASAYAGQTSLPPYVTAETATLPQPAP